MEDLRELLAAGQSLGGGQELAAELVAGVAVLAGLLESLPEVVLQSLDLLLEGEHTLTRIRKCTLQPHPPLPRTPLVPC